MRFTSLVTLAFLVEATFSLYVASYENEPAISYDYVVVGSGPGGGPVAANLAIAGFRVLLIEAGGDSGHATKEVVPALHFMSSEYEATTWNFWVNHYDDLGQQKKDSKLVYKLPDGTQYRGLQPPAAAEPVGTLYPRAGTLGGCSRHNAMITMYPFDQDWDNIATLTRDASWAARNMRQYFENIEKNEYLPPGVFGHGYSGWLTTSVTYLGLVLEDLKIVNIVLSGAAAAGRGLLSGLLGTLTGLAHILATDINAPGQLGKPGLYQVPIAMKDGARASPRERILDVANAVNGDGSRKYHLDIKLNTLVTKIKFDKSGRIPRATGVEYMEGKSLYRADTRSAKARPTSTGAVRASREVIIAGGAYNTPQLLKLSGVGPASELKTFGIFVESQCQISYVYLSTAGAGTHTGAWVQAVPPRSGNRVLHACVLHSAPAVERQSGQNRTSGGPAQRTGTGQAYATVHYTTTLARRVSVNKPVVHMCSHLSQRNRQIEILAMAALKITDAGLQLESSPSSRDSLPMQAFGITLNDSMIEDMIRCVQSGQNVELTLGNNPSFHFGEREENVSVIPENLNYELYFTDPADSGNKAQRLPHPTMSILKKPPPAVSTKKTTKVTTKQASRASSSGLDSDADTRAGSRAQKSSNGTRVVNGVPKGAKLLPTGRSAMASVYSSTTTRSLPSSPALNGVSSPNPAFSASQQVLEKNKGQRSALVHELAVKDQSFEHLKDVWTGAESDLKPTVEKVADFNKSTEKWSLKKIYWKELDVWNYSYNTSEDRQSAIENAIKVYDKQRMMVSDPVWDRLLKREDRGKNIVLSKLQATIAKQSTITPTPKISVQKADEGNKSDIDTSKAKGEAMSRSNSQPITSKPKKISEREAQTKRLLSSNPKKPAPKKPVSKVKATEEKSKRILSEEFVYDTDTSEEATPSSQSTTTAPKPKPIQKSVEKPAEKPVGRMSEKPVVRASEKPKEPPAPSNSLKSKPKPIVRPPRGPTKPLGTTTKSPQKRPREDEDSSSSSGAPLSKRIKPKELPKPVSEPKHNNLKFHNEKQEHLTHKVLASRYVAANQRLRS
ncbi:hypothetical protein NUW58_g1379 [Xylaria curta]|uniref:Uncharacterized protein n=1 Tax=Xylaria curta TaxID=42375 RepID=A0ACC1PL07_9PEZI|nr:hypothetical protein NUW58_g1379 [Xylaria curta]